MENVKPQLPWAAKKVTSEEMSVLGADPATFLIATAIMNRVRESISEMRKWLEDRPDLFVVLDTVLAGMKKAGLIDICDDRIVMLSEFMRIDMKDPKVSSSVYSVLNTVVKRLHTNILEKGHANAFPDAIAWVALPDHPKVRRRLAEIHSQFKAELNKLCQEAVEDPDLKGDRVRFVATLNGPICPEDF